MHNIILMTDSYKHSHYLQYDDNITYMHSYLESRGTDGSHYCSADVQFFGLQYYLKKYLSTPINQEMIEEASDVLKLHNIPFNREGWEYILKEHKGYLPLIIRAIDEGKVIKRRNVLLTIESTDKKVYWLVGFIETLLLKIWYPTRIATAGYNMKLMIKNFMELTCDNLDKLPFMLHDFGYRGVSSEESAMIGGMAHLVNFQGTDNLAAIIGAKKYYHSPMAGFSIPASEHSTITSFGVGTKNEKRAFEKIITTMSGNYPLYACVSDSWDFSTALDTWAELKPEIIKNDSILVIRPDSGDAKSNILLALRKLELSFGYKINKKGYKVLNHVALIQGDGVNSNQIYDILQMMTEHGYSTDNITFGMGGALLQGNNSSSLNRDTDKFAIKCSAIMKNGILEEVYKDPITDHGKMSKKGRLDLIETKDGYETVVLDFSEYSLYEYHPKSILKTYYKNGLINIDESLDNIRGK